MSADTIIILFIAWFVGMIISAIIEHIDPIDEYIISKDVLPFEIIVMFWPVTMPIHNLIRMGIRWIDSYEKIQELYNTRKNGYT